jgi:hypothetical protein
MSSSDDRSIAKTARPVGRGSARGDGGNDGKAAPVPLRRTGFGLTDLGRKRQSNEDAFFFDDDIGIYIVADGMGGHAAG